MSQEQFEQRPTPSAEPGPDANPGPIPGAKQVASVDDILDEIDSVLETNAESFVQGFVQKGGQ